VTQEIREIPIKDLVLWTENPRDPINPNASDQDIVDRAIFDSESKWDLKRLAKEMGGYFDYSELPTVVFHGVKPVVYDGNRRIVLGKIKHNFVTVSNFDVELPAFPRLIPCNVCSERIALQNVFRKHADTGSWLPLERDIFVHNHMKKRKSAFLLIEESTGLISANKHLNKRFVRDEIFREDNLQRLGLSFDGERLLSKHSISETRAILDDLSQKIKEKVISTRKNRGKVIEVLDPAHQRLVDEHMSNEPQPVNLRPTLTPPATPEPTPRTPRRRSRRSKPKNAVLFGGPLYLRIGPVSDLYRDVVDLYDFYLERDTGLSGRFPSLIRMALRLLWETAAEDCRQRQDQYIEQRFQEAKTRLNQDQKTTLSTQNVTKKSIVQLLHIGAHNYTASANVEQTLALSLILGGVLTISHGKGEES